MVAKDPEGQMVSIVGGALMVFMIGVCIACVCRAQRRKLRKIEKERRESLRESKEMPVPQLDLPTFEQGEGNEDEKPNENDHVIRGPDLSDSAMKERPAISTDDLRRSQSGIPKGAEDMFGLADE